DRARKDEDPSAELGLEPELAVDHGAHAVDVHRNGTRLAFCERRLDRAPDAREPARDHALRLRRVEQREQARRARVERMETMSESREELRSGCAPALKDSADRPVGIG